MSNFNLYETITNQIIEKLKTGDIVWQKPFFGSQVNYVTQKPYSGINMLLLPKTGEYLTFKQVKELNGTVKKGSKSHMVVYANKAIKKQTDKTDKTDYYFFMKYYRVFHLSDVEGIKSKLQTKEVATIEKAENIVKNWNNKPKIVEHNIGKAYYNLIDDNVYIPTKDLFKSTNGYYETLFHELIHSTGSQNRLKRHNIDINQQVFNKKNYSIEELVAEIGSSFLCSISGIETTIDNSAAYIQSWIKVLENDNKFIFTASKLAQKATNYILNKEVEKQEQKAS